VALILSEAFVVIFVMVDVIWTTLTTQGQSVPQCFLPSLL